MTDRRGGGAGVHGSRHRMHAWVSIAIGLLALVAATCAGGTTESDSTPAASDPDPAVDADDLGAVFRDVGEATWNGDLEPWYRSLACAGEVSRGDLQVEAVIMFNSFWEYHELGDAVLTVADVEVRSVSDSRAEARLVLLDSTGAPSPPSAWRPWVMIDGEWKLDCSVDDRYTRWIIDIVD